MSPDLQPYASFLPEEKWISKMDFIYRLKANCDCTDELHSRFLRFVYRFQFEKVTKTSCGKILVR